VVEEIRNGTLDANAGRVPFSAACESLRGLGHQHHPDHEAVSVFLPKWEMQLMGPGVPANFNRIRFRVGEFMGEVA